MIDFIKKNKEWLFSGVGVTVIVFFIGLFFQRPSNRPDNTIQSGKNNLQESHSNMIQSGENNIQAGRDVVIGTGLTIEQYRKGLIELEKRLIKKLSSPASRDNYRILEKELEAAREKLNNIEASFKEEKALRKKIEKNLKQFIQR